MLKPAQPELCVNFQFWMNDCMLSTVIVSTLDSGLATFSMIPRPYFFRWIA